jgi:glucan phosphoethanolaminetransferase (alkaline phosphatase superfamily)
VVFRYKSIILPGVARDWWWPWWISSLIDVGILVLAVIVFVRANRRRVRQIAAVVGIGAIVAAGLAPVVMQGKDSSSPMRMQTENTMTTMTP